VPGWAPLSERLMTPAFTMNLLLVTLVTLVIAAAIVDWRTHRIPNELVLIGAVLGVGGNAVLPSGGGVVFGVSGMALGLALLLPLYLLRAMGAGDVKLMAMVGAWIGPAGVFSAMLLTLVAGGVLALLVAMRNRTLGRALQNVKTMFLGTLVSATALHRTEVVAPVASAGKVPYAVAIAVGTFIHLALVQSGVNFM